MNRDRFKDAPWIDQGFSAVIGGAGGIGSWLALFLTRIGYHVYIFDNDIYESHNIGGQFVSHRDVGKHKTEALSSNISRFSDDTMINTYQERYIEDSFGHYTMISAFDNMESRKIMFDNWLRDIKNCDNKLSPIFIDGRLNMEQFQIFCVTNDKQRIKDYQEKHLFDDKEVEDTVCTMKQTSHVAAMIAGYMTGFLTNHVTNTKNKNSARVVPFDVEYFLPLNLHSNVSI